MTQQEEKQKQKRHSAKRKIMTRTQKIIQAYRYTISTGIKKKESAKAFGISPVELSDLLVIKEKLDDDKFNDLIVDIEEKGYFYFGSKKYSAIQHLSRKLRKASNSLDGLIFSKEEKDLLEPILSRLNDIFDISPKLLPAMILILQSKDLKRKVGE